MLPLDHHWQLTGFVLSSRPHYSAEPIKQGACSVCYLNWIEPLLPQSGTKVMSSYAMVFFFFRKTTIEPL